MTAEHLELWTIEATAIPATLFPVLYALFAPWWETVQGRALMTSKLALAALIDVSIWAYLFNTTPPTWLVLTIYLAIFCGAALNLGVLLHWQIWKRRR